MAGPASVGPSGVQMDDAAWPHPSCAASRCACSPREPNPSCGACITSAAFLCFSALPVTTAPQRGQLVRVGESGNPQLAHLINENPPFQTFPPTLSVRVCEYITNYR